MLLRLGHYTLLALKNTVGELLTNIKVVATFFYLYQGESTLTEPGITKRSDYPKDSSKYTRNIRVCSSKLDFCLITTNKQCLNNCY